MGRPSQEGAVDRMELRRGTDGGEGLTFLRSFVGSGLVSDMPCSPSADF